MTSKPLTRSKGKAFSLLEVVMASALCSIALVGGLELLRDGMDASRAIDHRQLMTNYAVSKLEEQMAIVASNWTTGSSTGDFATDGHADVRYTLSRSDAVVDGGMVDQLMHIEVTTYVDEDSDDLLDADEKSCYFRTKVAKMHLYELLAQ